MLFHAHMARLPGRSAGDTVSSSSSPLPLMRLSVCQTSVGAVGISDQRRPEAGGEKLARLRYSIARQSERTNLPSPASRSNIVVDADALIIVSHSQPPSLFRILAGCGSGSPTRIATLPLLLYC
jgi:hypothetical protein